MSERTDVATVRDWNRDDAAETRHFARLLAAYHHATEHEKRTQLPAQLEKQAHLAAEPETYPHLATEPKTHPQLATELEKRSHLPTDPETHHHLPAEFEMHPHLPAEPYEKTGVDRHYVDETPESHTVRHAPEPEHAPEQLPEAYRREVADPHAAFATAVVLLAHTAEGIAGCAVLAQVGDASVPTQIGAAVGTHDATVANPLAAAGVTSVLDEAGEHAGACATGALAKASAAGALAEVGEQANIDEADVNFVVDGAGESCSNGVPQLELKRLWVEPTARGNGLAGALVRAAIERADAAGAVLRLSVWNWRDGAIRLYERLGFAVVPSWDPRPELLCLERSRP